MLVSNCPRSTSARHSSPDCYCTNSLNPKQSFQIRDFIVPFHTTQTSVVIYYLVLQHQKPARPSELLPVLTRTRIQLPIRHPASDNNTRFWSSAHLHSRPDKPRRSPIHGSKCSSVDRRLSTLLISSPLVQPARDSDGNGSPVPDNLSSYHLSCSSPTPVQSTL